MNNYMEGWLDRYIDTEVKKQILSHRSVHVDGACTFQYAFVADTLCLTLCDPMNLSRPGLPVHHQLPEFTQTHIH